ncbi:MAG: hypothetical protein VKJ04_10355 [Vampirovibrionales bacterium]|nr:hypothetical protein [Vampirovibrionales bacterium]
MLIEYVLLLKITAKKESNGIKLIIVKSSLPCLLIETETHRGVNYQLVGRMNKPKRKGKQAANDIIASGTAERLCLKGFLSFYHTASLTAIFTENFYSFEKRKESQSR